MSSTSWKFTVKEIVGKKEVKVSTHADVYCVFDARGLPIINTISRYREISISNLIRDRGNGDDSSWDKLFDLGYKCKKITAKVFWEDNIDDT